MSVTEAAGRLGISRQTLHKILAEKSPVTAEMALRLGKFCGNGPGLWLRMQQQVDLWDAERTLARELAKISLARRATVRGRPRTTISGDGVVASNSGSGFQAAFTVAALPDGALLAGGVAQVGSSVDLQVIRYRANGNVDGTWGDFGGLTIPIDRVTDGWDELLRIVPAASASPWCA